MDGDDLPKKEKIKVHAPVGVPHSEASQARNRILHSVSVDNHTNQGQELGYYTYSCIRESKTFKATSFSFSLNDNTCLNANTNKWIHPTSCEIKNTEGIIIARIIISDNSSLFQVIEGNSNHIISTISVKYEHNDVAFPRVWKYEDKMGNKLKSRRPMKMKDGKYGLFFGGRLTIESIKNCILIDEIEAAEVIAVRKIEENIIEVDVETKYTPLDAFAIALAAFLAR